MTSGWKLALAIAAFVAASSIVAYRVLETRTLEGQPDLPRYGLVDFRGAIYYPTRAFLAGDNPYNAEAYRAKYPAGDSFPPYSPLTFVVHAPFALLGYERAQAAYFLACLAMMLGLAAISLRFCAVPASAAAVIGLAALLLLSRPGQWTVYGGQLSLQMAIAIYLALWFARTNPMLSGFGLALATLKPTYGVPLAILMLIRGDRRALAAGVAIAVLVTAMPAGRMAMNSGTLPLLESFKASYTQRETVARKRPENSPLRVDAVALRARLSGESPSLPQRGLIMAILVAFAGVGLRRLREETAPPARLLSLGIAALTILLCIYHSQYDAVCLTAPFLAAVLSGRTGVFASSPRLRWTVIAAFGIVFINYFSSYTAAGIFGWDHGTVRAWSSLNGVALLVALAAFVAGALSQATPAQSR